jgi:hypothetical protein
VRASEAACPFCGAARAASPETYERIDGPSTAFAGRSQIMGYRTIAGAAIVAGATALANGCGAPVPVYGGPDAARPDGGAPVDAATSIDTGGSIPVYGGPDAAPDIDAGVDAGPVAPAYGAPGP